MNHIRIIFFCLLVLIISDYVYAQGNDTITFFNAYHFIKNKHSEDKSTFIYLYYDFKKHKCRIDSDMYKRSLYFRNDVLKDPEIVQYINQNFRCYTAEVHGNIGKKIREMYDIEWPFYAVCLFISPDRKLRQISMGYHNKDAFFKQLKAGTGQQPSLSFFHNKLRKGHFDPETCYNYIMLKYKSNLLYMAVNDTDELCIKKYINSLSYDQMDQYKNMEFIYRFGILDVFNNLLIHDSNAFNHLLSNKSKYQNYFDSLQVECRILDCLGEGLNQAGKKKDREQFDKLIKMIKYYDSAAIYYFDEFGDSLEYNGGFALTKNITFLSTYTFHRLSGNIDSATYYLNKYIEAIWNDSRELFYYSIGYIDWAKDDPNKLKKCLPWMKRCIKLDPNTETYFYYAQLLFYLGELDQAERMAKISKKYAQLNGNKYIHMPNGLLKDIKTMREVKPVFKQEKAPSN